MIIDPDEETLREYEKKRQDEKNRQELLQQLKGKPTVTKEGKEIKLYANIGEVKDLGAVLQNDAAGIGLFRSEFYICRVTISQQRMSSSSPIKRLRK